MAPLRIPGWRARLAASLGTAALFAPSQPGPDLAPLVFVALVPWAAANLAAPIRKAWLADYAAGLLFFCLATAWLARVSLVAAAIVIPVSALTFVFAGAIFRRTASRVPAALSLPVVWVAAEWLRTICPPGGFPMGLLGAGLYEVRPLIQVADLGGAYLVSALAACANGAIADSVAKGLGWREVSRKRLVVDGALAAIALVGPLAYGAARGRTPVVDGPVVTIVQGNIGEAAKEEVLSGRVPDAVLWVFERHLELTEGVAEPGDLVLWPETMFPEWLGGGAPGEVLVRDGEIAAAPREFTQDDSRAIEDAWVRRGVLRALGGKSAFMFGVNFLDRFGTGFRPFNTALLYSPKGERVARYHKVHLVPGGEYLPWRRAVPFADAIGRWIESWAGYFPDFEAGEGPVLFEIDDAQGRRRRFGVGICWDNAYADLFRANARAGAEFHVVLSNEAHFGESMEMEQLLAHAVFRAIETRRSVVRATNTGISALVTPDGEIAAVLEKDGKRKEVGGTLTVRVPVADRRTLFGRVGDGVPWGATVGAALLALLVGRGGRRLPEPPRVG